MALINLARKYMIDIYRYIFQKNIFKHNYKKRKLILERFREPRSLFERSWFQYLCQTKELIFLIRALQNLVAVFLLPFYFFIYYREPENYVFKDRHPKAVFLTNGISTNIIPASLREKYELIIEHDFSGRLYLGKQEKIFIKTVVFQYWRSPFFCLKCLIKIGMYANIFAMYAPDAMIVYSEYSFTSSILTAYCRSVGVKHINVLHGDKLFNIRDAFVAFDRFYVWDEYYREMYLSMRVEPTQMRVEVPPSLYCMKKIDGVAITYDYIYYLGGASRKDLFRIAAVLKTMSQAGIRVCVRFHPRYSRTSYIYKIFEGLAIENPWVVDLAISLSRTTAAVSLNSTVLYQACICGKKVVIDDITNEKKFKRLKDLGYIMLNKPHRLLSEVLDST